MSFDRLVLHQLELTNSIEAAKPVKTRNAETTNEPQLLAIHYCFARGLQEKRCGKSGGDAVRSYLKLS
jgi:hypothetical protein